MSRYRDILREAAPEMLKALESVEECLMLASVSDEEEGFFAWVDANDKAAVLVANVLKRVREEL